MLDAQTITVMKTVELNDGTFIMATAMPDLPGSDGGYVILSHLKISAFDFAYTKEKPKMTMQKGWDIDSITEAKPSLKVLSTKIFKRDDYNETVKDFTLAQVYECLYPQENLSLEGS